MALAGRRWIAIASVALFVLVSAFLWWRGRAVPVIEPARRELVQSLVVTGRVLPPARVAVGPITAGTVAEVRVDEGDAVQRGQLLLRLDDAEEEAAVAEAQAALAEAKARQAQLRTVQLPQADAAVRRAQAELEEARKQWERYRALHQSGALAESSLDQAERRLDVARADLERAELARRGALGGAEAALAAAAVSRAEATLRLAEARRDRTRLLAPVEGRVLSRAVEVGDAVQPGSVLLTLAAAGPTEVEIEPDERNLAALEVGQQVLVAADAFPSRPFAAVVRRIAPAVDRQRGTVEVRLEVPEPPPFLRPDMTVSAEVEVGRKADALVLPVEAVRDAGSGRPWVLVVEDGRAVRREVRLGLVGQRWLEVVEGLAEGEAVIPPASGVAPGDRVRVGERVPVAQGERGGAGADGVWPRHAGRVPGAGG